MMSLVADVAAMTVDFAVPGSVTTVLKILQQVGMTCMAMKEGRDLYEAVLERLTDLCRQLQIMREKDNLPLDADVIHKYGEILLRFHRFLEKNKQKNALMRLASSRYMLEGIQEFHRDIDTLFKLLNLAHVDAMMDWRRRYELDLTTMHRQMAYLASNSQLILDEIRDKKVETEVLTMLKFEADHRRQFHSQQHLDLLRTTFNRVVKLSQADVQAIPPWFIPIDEVDYEHRPFSQGSFGSVHHGIWGPGTRVVVKRLLDDSAANQRAKESFMHEVNLWYQFNHPHVVKMYGACHVSSPPFIVCEDAVHGNLDDYLAHKRHARKTWRMLYQAALGLFYLHERKVVHGDLKCNNILVGADDLAKIADFGFSFIRSRSSALSQKAQTGAVRWKAPECLQLVPPSFESDVYSLAMCIIEVLTGQAPWGMADDDDIRRRKELHGGLPPRPAQASDVVWDLIVRMGANDKKDRMRLDDVIKEFKGLADAELQQELALASDTQCQRCAFVNTQDMLYCGKCGCKLEQDHRQQQQPKPFESCSSGRWGSTQPSTISSNQSVDNSDAYGCANTYALSQQYRGYEKDVATPEVDRRRSMPMARVDRDLSGVDTSRSSLPLHPTDDFTGSQQLTECPPPAYDERWRDQQMYRGRDNEAIDDHEQDLRKRPSQWREMVERELPEPATRVDNQIDELNSNSWCFERHRGSRKVSDLLRGLHVIGSTDAEQSNQAGHEPRPPLIHPHSWYQLPVRESEFGAEKRELPRSKSEYAVRQANKNELRGVHSMHLNARTSPEVLFRVLLQGSPQERAQARQVLECDALDVARNIMEDRHALKMLLGILESGAADQQLLALGIFRTIVSSGEQYAVDRGVIAMLLRMLAKHSSTALRRAVATALVQSASSPVVVDELRTTLDGIAVLVDILKRECESTLKQRILELLQILVQDSASAAIAVVDTGGVPCLLDIQHNGDPTCSKAADATLRHLASIPQGQQALRQWQRVERALSAEEDQPSDNWRSKAQDNSRRRVAADNTTYMIRNTISDLSRNDPGTAAHDLVVLMRESSDNIRKVALFGGVPALGNYLKRSSSDREAVTEAFALLAESNPKLAAQISQSEAFMYLVKLAATGRNPVRQNASRVVNAASTAK